MKITAENNQYREPRKKNKPVSLVASGLVGATVGYASKYAMPVTKDEMDNFYPEPDKFVKVTKEVIKESQLNELDSVRRQLGKNASPKTKEFLDSVEGLITNGNKKPLLDIYHGAKNDPNMQKVFKDTITQITKAKKLVKNVSLETQKALIKSSRDTFKYASIGAVISVGAAFVHNVFDSITNG